jgi:hypothetical protein
LPTRRHQDHPNTGNAPLNAYYLDVGYRVVGHKAGKPQPGGAPKSFTLLEKACGPVVAAE